MQILNAFFKIAGKLRGTLIMYAAIFITIAVTFSLLSPDTSAVFEQSRLKVVIFDNDNTPESRALCDFIAKNHDIVEMENDPEKLWDNLYYHAINYVLTVESGYSEKLKNGDTEGLLTYSVDPQSYSCEYLNMQLRQYISSIGLYLKSGRDLDSAQAAAVKTLENDTEVTPINFTESTAGKSLESKFVVFMRYLAYIMPAIMITVLSRIIIELRGDDIKNRTFCSPIPQIKYNGQIIAGSMIFCVAIWILTTLMAFIFGGFPAMSENVLLAVINAFVFMLVSSGLGMLISMCFSSNSFAIDMIANIVCLGMSFLCGVFVDQSLLGESVLNVGKFLPAYWYVRAIDSIGQISGAVFDSSLIWQCIGVEALFAVALFAVSLVVARFKKS